MILEMLLHLVALDLGYFLGLIFGNIFIVFGLGAVFYLRLGAKSIPAMGLYWIGFLAMLDIIALMGWDFVAPTAPFETLVIVGITVPILINKTILEKHALVISVVLLLGGSLFVSL